MSGDIDADSDAELDKRLAAKSREAAVRKAMNYLSIRDHSRHELMKKLLRFDFSNEDILHAITYVQEGGWLLSPEAMAAKVADQLHRKKKSHFYIQGYLRQKKLPNVPRIAEIEEEKAQKLLAGRFSHLSNPSLNDKKKMAQFLQSRGFDRQTISRAINGIGNDTSGTSESF